MHEYCYNTHELPWAECGIVECCHGILRGRLQWKWFELELESCVWWVFFFLYATHTAPWLGGGGVCHLLYALLRKKCSTAVDPTTAGRVHTFLKHFRGCCIKKAKTSTDSMAGYTTKDLCWCEDSIVRKSKSDFLCKPNTDTFRLQRQKPEIWHPKNNRKLQYKHIWTWHDLCDFLVSC